MKATFAPHKWNQLLKPDLSGTAKLVQYLQSGHQPFRTLASELVGERLYKNCEYRVRKGRNYPELMGIKKKKKKAEPEKSSSLTHVVVFVLWSMKKGRPFGAIRISQPGGRKLCVTLCCGLGEL